jgi:hypothetical protein
MRVYLFVFILLISTTPMMASAQTSHKRLYFSLAGKGGTGTAGSDEKTFYKSRDFYTYGADATLGMVFSGVLIGASAEYNIWNQKTEAKEVSNTNLSGKQLNLSPVIGIGLGRFMFQFKPYLFSTMALDQKSVSGDKVTFDKPDTASFGAQIIYSLGRTFIGVDYSQIKYKQLSLGSDETKLSDKNQVNFSAIRIVYGIKF